MANALLSILVAALLAGCGEDDDPASTQVEETKPRKPSGSREEPNAGRHRGAYRAFVALEDESALAVLKGPPWRVARRTRVASAPHNVSASANGRYVAVSSPPAGEVTVVDSRGRVVGRPEAGAGVHDVAFTPNASGLWVTAEDASRLVKLDVPSGRPLGSRATAGPPHDLDVSPDGRELWVTIDGSEAVEVRSARNGRLLDRPTLGGAPHDVAFAPGGRHVWFSNWSSPELTVASASGRERVGSLTAGAEPHHFAFGLRSLWATDHEGGELLRIDPESRQVRGATRVGPAPHHPAVAGPHVLVAVHGSGQLAVVSREGRLVRRVEVGAGPHGVAALQR